MKPEVISTFFFYGLTFLVIFFSVFVVSSKNILRSALSLFGALCVSAGFYLFLGAEFVAGIQILVYVGGIVVLMVFAIMLTGAHEEKELEQDQSRKIYGALFSIFFFLVVSMSLILTPFEISNTQSSLKGAKEIGLKLLDYGAQGFVIPFEVISILLLTALIGGIVVARKDQA